MPIESLIFTLVPFIFFVFILILLLTSFKKVEDGKAMIITGVRGKRVTFSSSLVIPILEQYELIDITIKQILIDLKGEQGLLTKDNYIVDLKSVFNIRIMPTRECIMIVGMSMGTKNASDLQFLEGYFSSEFSEALRIAAANFTFEDLKLNLEEYKVEVLKTIGMDLNGFALDDLTINYVATSVRKLKIK